MEVTFGTLNRLKDLLISNVSRVYHKLIRELMRHWFVQNYELPLGAIIVMISAVLVGSLSYGVAPSCLILQILGRVNR